MSDLLAAAALGGAAFALALALGTPRRWWTIVAAALILGFAGYAWQGRPGLAASPARPEAETVEISPELVDLRGRMVGRFNADAAFFTAADALLRAGDRDAAARFMLGGVHAQPTNAMLWMGLGSMLAVRDGDQVSPAALLAFRRAIQLAPRNPAPWFYLGLAYVRAGDADKARPLWRRAIALSPDGASYRTDIAQLLALLDMMTRAR